MSISKSAINHAPLNYTIAPFADDWVLRAEKSNDSALIARILIMEAQSYSVYFSSGNRDAAEESLREYVQFLDDFSARNKITPAIARTLHSGRALALARLELLSAQKQKRPVDLTPAILEWRKFKVIDGEHPDDAKIRNLLVSFLRSDVPKAPWLPNYDDIINRGGQTDGVPIVGRAQESE